MFSVSSARLWKLKTQEATRHKLMSHARLGGAEHSNAASRTNGGQEPAPVEGPVGFICNAPAGHGG